MPITSIQKANEVYSSWAVTLDDAVFAEEKWLKDFSYWKAFADVAPARIGDNIRIWNRSHTERVDLTVVKAERQVSEVRSNRSSSLRL